MATLPNNAGTALADDAGLIHMLKYQVHPTQYDEFIGNLLEAANRVREATGGMTRLRVLRRSVLGSSNGPIFVLVEHRNRETFHHFQNLQQQRAFNGLNHEFRGRLEDADMLVEVNS